MIKPPTLSVELSREVDRLASEEFGIPSIILMENAGRELSNHIEKFLHQFPRTTYVVFLCGHGNNGGDGFVAIRHLYLKHPNIKIYLSDDPEKISGDALINFQILKKLGFTFGRYLDFAKDCKIQFRGTPLVFVDALLGTGLKGEASGDVKSFIQDVVYLKKYHNAKATVISADIPSGMHGDDGPIWPTVMPADLTVTFGCPKKGLMHPSSRSFTGRLEIVDIGLPEPLLKRYL